MAAILSKYQITWVDPSDNVSYVFFFLAPSNHYDGIQAETGVTKLPDNSKLKDMPVTKAGELSLSPVASRKSIRYVANGKKKYADILIASGKANDAQDLLFGKDYKNGKIERVLDPRKATKF